MDFYLHYHHYPHSQHLIMGRDLMLELEKSLSRVCYNNSFLFYRYQFDQSDLLQISWTPNFGTRRQISRLVSDQIKDLYEKEMDCYTIRWYTKDTADETTYTIEVMVRLLESVKIPIGNSVCVNDVHSSVHICTHILYWQIILSSATTQAKFEMFPAYYWLLDLDWIQSKLSYGVPCQYQDWHQLESSRWHDDGENGNCQEINPLLHHYHDNAWAQIAAQCGKLPLVKLSVALGVQSEMIREALDNRDVDLVDISYYIDSVNGIEHIVTRYTDSTTVVLDST